MVMRFQEWAIDMQNRLRLMIFCAGVVACKSNADSANVADAVDAVSRARFAPAQSSSAPTQPDPSVSCDADKLWFAIDADTPDARRTKFVSVAKTWTPDCRARAMASLCEERGCNEGVSDPLIAAATSAEIDALRRSRLEGNRKAAIEGRAVYNEVAKFGKYALSMRSSPRSSAYRSARPTTEEIAGAIVNGDPCITRMKKDFAKVGELRSKLTAAVPRSAPIIMGLRTVVDAAQSCLTCDDNRTMCDEIAEPMKNADEFLRRYETLVASDRKVLGGSK